MRNIICNADCLAGMKLLHEGSIDLIVTSPPYDNIRDYNKSSVWNEEVFCKIADEIYRVMKPGGVVVWIVGDATINKSETGTSFRQALYFMKIGFLLHDTMIWEKFTSFQHRNRYISSFEYMFIFSKCTAPKTANLIRDRKNKYAFSTVHGTERQKDGSTKPRSVKQKSKTIKEYGARTNIWKITPNKHNRTGHPAVFPEQLAADHIRTWSNEGDIVLDPFLGSGTTALAAYKLNRSFMGFEIDSACYAIAKNQITECVPDVCCFDAETDMLGIYPFINHEQDCSQE